MGKVKTLSIDKRILEQIKLEGVRGAGINPNSKLEHDEKLIIIIIQALTNTLKRRYNIDVEFELDKELLDE